MIQPYLQASQNFDGSWNNPEHFDKVFSVSKQALAFVGANTRIPADKLNSNKFSSKYSFIKHFGGDGLHYVVRYDPFYGHTITETMPWVFFLAKVRPDIKIIIITTDYENRQRTIPDTVSSTELKILKQKSERTVFSLFIKILNHLNVKYETLYLNHQEYFTAENVLIMNKLLRADHQRTGLASMVYTLKDFILEEDIDPSKKIYLSRRKVDHDDFNNDDVNNDTKQRILNEDVLEKFFEGLGFDIISPEDFDSFEDQVRFFANVRVVVGPTASSLNNILWMKPGQTVIELSVALHMDDHYEIHNHYQETASFMSHNFLRIPVIDREAEAIINMINSNPSLKLFLESL